MEENTSRKAAMGQKTSMGKSARAAAIMASCLVSLPVAVGGGAHGGMSIFI
jgi:hypothetical protein